MKRNLFYAMVLAMLVIVTGCSQTNPVAYAPGQDVPSDQLPPGEQVAQVTLQFDGQFKVAGPRALGMDGIEGTFTGPVEIAGNVWRQGTSFHTYWDWDIWEPNEPVTWTVIAGKWGNMNVSSAGHTQVDNFTVNGVRLQHYVNLNAKKGLFASVRFMPDSSGVIVTQPEYNLDRLVTLHIKLFAPQGAYSGVEITGTHACWINRREVMTYDAGISAWQAWVKMPCTTEGLLAFKAVGGGAISNRVVTMRSDAPGMTEELMLTCQEVVTNPTTYFPDTPWFTDRTWLTNQPVLRYFIDDQGVVYQNCAGQQFPAKVVVVDTGIPANNVIKAVSSGVNNGAPFTLTRVGTQWESQSFQWSLGINDLSVWDETDQSQPVIGEVKWGTTTLVHLEAFGDQEEYLKFSFMIIPGPAIAQDEDNRLGNAGAGGN